MPPALSIIVVSYNTRDDLLRCLESVAANAPTVTWELVVVDNASTDGSPDAVRARWPDARVLVQPQNVGFAAANNIGFRSTSGDLVLLLNSDTVVPARAIDVLIATLARRPDVAAAGPRLIDGDGVVELSFGSMMTPFAELRQKALTALHHRRVPWVSRLVDRQASIEHLVDWVSGAALLVRRGDAEAVGLLDERFFLYTEDVDFCAALRARGRGVLFTPAATVTHLRGRSRATAPTVMNAAYRRSQIAFYEKHHPRWVPLLRAYLRMKGQLPVERTEGRERNSPPH